MYNLYHINIIQYDNNLSFPSRNELKSFSVVKCVLALSPHLKNLLKVLWNIWYFFFLIPRTLYSWHIYHAPCIHDTNTTHPVFMTHISRTLYSWHIYTMIRQHDIISVTMLFVYKELNGGMNISSFIGYRWLTLTDLWGNFERWTNVWKEYEKNKHWTSTPVTRGLMRI